MKNYISSGDILTLTTDSNFVNVVSGNPVAVGGICGVLQGNGRIDDAGNIEIVVVTRGLFELQVEGTAEAGSAVYINSMQFLSTEEEEGAKFFGYLTEATNGSGKARVFVK